MGVVRGCGLWLAACLYAITHWPLPTCTGHCTCTHTAVLFCVFVWGWLGSWVLKNLRISELPGKIDGSFVLPFVLVCWFVGLCSSARSTEREGGKAKKTFLTYARQAGRQAGRQRETGRKRTERRAGRGGAGSRAGHGMAGRGQAK